ncbi:TPA: hypothetical protein KYG11_004437 [Salmonella enterica]|nr:hypothetical protein [Salmonella enterica]
MGRRITEEELKNRLAMFGFKLVKYGGSQVAKSVIKCPNGHEELKSLNTFTANGVRCKSCAAAERSRAYSTDETEARKIVEDMGYSLIAYGGDLYRKKSTVQCTNGHVREVRIGNMVKGHRCKKCAAEAMCAAEDTVSTRLPAGVKMDFYCGNMSGRSLFSCEKGHSWATSANNVVSQQTKCPKCSNNVSGMEKEVLSFIRSVYPGVVNTSVRSLISPFELDIVLPDIRVAIEFNGVYWHSEANGKHRNYHINKRLACEKLGYRLISVRSDLWLEKREHVERILKNAVGVRTGSIFARKCRVVEVTNKDAFRFCEDNHIQGGTKATKAYALLHAGEMVAVMTLVHWRSKDSWELARYCTSTSVPGGLSKLWKHVAQENNIKQAFTYTDRDLFTGASYAEAGFIFDSCSVGFRVVVGTRTESRQKWSKAPDGLTQTEWYEREKVSRIWDSGQDKWEWVKGA